MEVEEIEPFHWYITDRSVKLFFITFFIFLLSFLLFVFLFIRYIRNQIALFPDDDDDNDITVPSATPTARRQMSSRSNGIVSFTPAAALPSRERPWPGERVIVDLEEVTGSCPSVFGQQMLDDDGTMKTRRFGGDECCICLGVFEEKEMVKVMPECMHVFHSQCIVRWLTARSNCPLCRSTI